MLLDAIVAVTRRVVIQAGGAMPYGDAQREIDLELSDGPLSEDQVLAMLERGLEQASSPLVVTGDWLVDVETIAEKAVLTHRLTKNEIASGRLDVTADLALFERLGELHGGLHLPDGQPLRPHRRPLRNGRTEPDGLGLGGPAGWLTPFEEGQLVAVRVADGFLDMQAVGDDDVSPLPIAPAAALAELLNDTDIGEVYPSAIWTMVLTAVVEHPDWFAEPRPPLVDLAVEAGVAVDADVIGPADRLAHYHEQARAIETTVRHNLPEPVFGALLGGLEAFAAWRADGQVADRMAVRRLHRHWGAVLALDEELRRRGAADDEIEAFATALGEDVHDQAAAVSLWLAARSAGRAGRAADAERLARRALALDPHHAPIVQEVAWYTEDAGQVRETLNLLQAVRQPDNPHIQDLQRILDQREPTVGRNNPCPCGSGRKFKQCHLGRSEPAEGQRVRWLLEKARQYVLVVMPPELADDVLHAHCDGSKSGEAAHMFALDVLLFDEGWLRRFVEARRSLLSAWEVATAERWVEGSVASAFRVEAVDAAPTGAEAAARALVLRDVADGSVRRAVEDSGLRFAEVDLLVWTRLLPVDDRWYPVGVGREVPPFEQPQLLAAAGDQLDAADRVGSNLGKDVDLAVLNASGHPTVLCHSTVLAPTTTDGSDRDADEVLAAALDAFLSRGDERRWLLRRDPDAPEGEVVGRVSVLYGQLTVSTRSIPSHEELLGLLTDKLGELTVKSEHRTPLLRHQSQTEEEDLATTARRILGLEDDLDDDYLDDSYDDDLYDDEDEDLDDDVS